MDSQRIYAGIAEGDRRSGYSLYFPDLPGCVTAGDTLGELVVNAREAVELHLEGMLAEGKDAPEPTPMEDLPHEPDVKEAGVILVDAAMFEPRARINVTIAKRLLARVDQAAQADGLDRSAFLESAAREKLATRTTHR